MGFSRFACARAITLQEILTASDQSIVSDRNLYTNKLHTKIDLKYYRNQVCLQMKKFFVSVTSVRNFSRLCSKGGRSENKFRKSQNRKFEDLKNLFDLPPFRKCGTSRTQTFVWFTDLKLPQVRKYILFLFTKKHIMGNALVNIYYLFVHKTRDF